MLSQQAIASIASNRFHSLIDRVLHLRRQLGIDIPLSMSDSEDTLLSSGELCEPSMETPRHALPTYNSRDWQPWSQSPGEGNRPEKGEKELL